MIKSRKKQIQKASPVVGYLIGFAVAILISIVIPAFLSICIINEYIDINFSDFSSVIAQFLSTFFGVFIAIKIIKENKIVSSIIIGGGYLAILICTAMLFFDGISVGIIRGFISCVAGSAAAILVDAAPKNKHKRKHHIKRSC